MDYIQIGHMSSHAETQIDHVSFSIFHRPKFPKKIEFREKKRFKCNSQENSEEFSSHEREDSLPSIS